MVLSKSLAMPLYSYSLLNVTLGIWSETAPQQPLLKTLKVQIKQVHQKSIDAKIGSAGRFLNFNGCRRPFFEVL